MRARSQLPVYERLAAASARGLGAANAIAAEALRSTGVLDELVAALFLPKAREERAIVVVRAANALKKVQKQRSELLAPYAKKIVRAAIKCEEMEARWNLTIVVGRLPLRGRDRALAVELMFEALRSESAFLRTFAMQGLADMAREDAALRRRVRPIVEEFAESGTAAMRARARKLLTAVRR